MNKSVPRFDDMYEAVIAVLKQLGGSATKQEIDEDVAKYMQLDDQQINQLHNDKGTQTRLNYNLAWTRTYLKAFGVLENPQVGVWLLTQKGYTHTDIVKNEINDYVRRNRRTQQQAKQVPHTSATHVNQFEDLEEWREQLMEAVLELPPSGFERLCQYLLRVSGFIDVEVLGKSGDGGIDGKGSMQLGGLLKFQCFFQCKRYKGSVASKEIRDFRGAMVGRSDKGLFITTGVFTNAAKEEANRDGAPSIDLVDGEKLLDKMFELKLGLKVKESFIIDKEWFQKFE